MSGTDYSCLNIAILGTGREGQAAARHLRRTNPGLVLTFVDENEPAEGFRETLGTGDQLALGPLCDAELEQFDLLVRSPGVSPYRESIRRAHQAGVRITTASTLWFESNPDANTICISGTKGKSTTSALLTHLLKACGLNVRLAGNIGRPLLDCNNEGVDWWIIELSSYQLADLEASPDVSVLLNLTPEHLDWHGSEQVYREDKLRLAALADERVIVANRDDPVLRQALEGRSNVTWFNAEKGFSLREGRISDDGRDIGAGQPAGLPGIHNLANAAAALTVVRVIGADTNLARKALAGFRSLPHRLQVIGATGGLRFINDSISSTPVATAAALESLPGEQVCLIVGGLDRGVDWSPYMNTFRKHLPHAVIAVPDSGLRILGTLRGHGIEPCAGLHESPGLDQAIDLARKLAPPGGVVLLSPGAPSFPRFHDYRDRGHCFTRLCGFELEEDILFRE